MTQMIIVINLIQMEIQQQPIPVAEIVGEQLPITPPVAIQGYSQDQTGYRAPPVVAAQEKSISLIPMAYTPETINEQSMRNALTDLVKSKIFWGKGAVKQMSIGNIQTWNSYYCTWETFMESRQTKWKTRPYEGGMVDTTEYGIPPQPWDIPVEYPPLFKEGRVKIPVPHTESVSQCNDCYGRGRIQCHCCNGAGRVRCSTCSGSGRVTRTRDNETREVECSSCHGSGRVTCSHCHGDGMEKCDECKGQGRVVNYVQLTVEFVNHVDEEVIDESGMPDDVIKKSISTTVCDQSGFHILPPQDVFEPSIRAACGRLYTTAENRIMENKERLLQQRVRVTVIPVAKAVGTWKSKSCEFWVHGNNKVAYAPRYAKEFYHGCSIMYCV